MAETPKLILSAADAPAAKVASKAARTNFFIVMLPSVSLSYAPCLRHGNTMPFNEFIFNKND
ncbi:hypothetical protein EcWSU1_01424 [Enterobacter ludwigii]|uniref:Uncharacterized protein n=1 Tax=Enterobacter ludwigii TaxID=299767 RepID=G8LGU0_9ENTR|nr:hypothetical protein EcWSU1_01424 [Enterobacter ludwigii]